MVRIGEDKCSTLLDHFLSLNSIGPRKHALTLG